jgi:hypothetical protein
MSFEDLADAWELWSEERQKVVLTYRPDVFDSHDYPAPCLPTIYITKGKRRRKPGKQTRPDDPWHVTLFLEPEVGTDSDSFQTREDALAGATELANRFHEGELDYRSLYQVPREHYLDRLDELTGRDNDK